MYSDDTTTLNELKKLVKAFTKERDWEQFHDPKNMSINVGVEAGELMEHFLWIDNKNAQDHFERNKKEITHELADVLIGVVEFAQVCNIDLATAFSEKLEEIKKKYPADKVRGKAEKYTSYS